MGIIKIKCAGIYKIEHIHSGEYYIGKSVDIFGRWSQHYTNIIFGKHTSKKLEILMKSTSVEQFTFSILEYSSKTEFNKELKLKGAQLKSSFSSYLLKREKHWMNQYSITYSLNKQNSHFIA